MHDRLDKPDSDQTAQHRSGMDARGLAEYEDLIGIAIDCCQASGAVLCVSDGAQWRVRARAGITVDGAREICQALAGPVSAQLLICEDTQTHNPALQQLIRLVPASVAAFAGVPVLTGDGASQAVVVVMDERPRAFNEHQIVVLQRVARQVARLFELHAARMASVQPHSRDVHPREERFRWVSRAVRDTVWDWDPGSNRIWVSDESDVNGENSTTSLEDWVRRIHAEDRERIVRGLQQAIATAQTIWSEEYRFQRSDGQWIWVEDRACIFRASDDAPGRVVGLMRDITEKRQREEALRRMEERFATVFWASPDPMAIMALDDSAFLDVNEAFLFVSGCSRDEVIGRTAQELGVTWVTPEMGLQIRETVHQGGRIRDVEIRLRLRTGKIWLGLLSAERIEIDGRPCLLTVTKDISEIRRLEEQLLQAQKMDAIGRLAGGIAHDFNNFLTIIHGYSEVLLTQVVDLPDMVRQPVLEMRAAAERAAGLTRQLLAFSRQQILRLQDVDLNRVISSNERMLRSAISEQVDLRLRLEPMLGRIQADPSQIDQVILNLVINARDAMPHGGSITIETGNVQFSRATAFGQGQVPAGRWVRLAVKDSGHGMNDAVQARIFEPFFTTKADDQGTGLGLATVYGIVKQSGGYIAVSSTPGAGATFEILLPRFDVPAQARMEESPSRSPLEGTETILLVEDEEAIRLLCREVLEGQGYTVFTADNGEDALRVAGEVDGPIHLLIADIVLPRVSGEVLAATLRHQRPAMAVLFMSGMSDDLRTMHPAQAGEAPFLQKPFSPARLSRTVRDLLDRTSSGAWLQ